MEKELYVINKEAKRLRDLNRKIWEREEDDTSYDEELVNSGLLHELVYYYDRDKKDKAEGGQYIHINNLEKARENEIRMWREGDTPQDELECIEDNITDWVVNAEMISKSIHDIFTENKSKIECIYNLKEKVLTELLKEKKASIIGAHKFDFTFKRESHSDLLYCIQYNEFKFHLKINDEIKSLGFDVNSYEVKTIADEIDATNKLDNFDLSYEECYARLEEWVKKKSAK